MYIQTMITNWKTWQFCPFFLSKWMENWSWIYYCRKQPAFIFLQATLIPPGHNRFYLLEGYIRSHKSRRNTPYLSSLEDILYFTDINCNPNNEQTVGVSTRSYAPAVLMAPSRPDPNPENFTNPTPNSEIYLQHVHSVIWMWRHQYQL